MTFSALVFGYLSLTAVLSDSARIDAGRIVVEPIGISFEIPAGWQSKVSVSGGPTCDPKSAQTRSVNVDKSALRTLTGPSSYFGDQYYSAFADSVFAVSELVAHLGALGWRDCDNTVSDLQMRVYVTDRSPAEIARRLPAVQLSPYRGYSTPKVAAARDSAAWHIEQVNWSFNCGDCIFDERVEIYSTRVGVRTVSLMFMYMPIYPRETQEMPQRIRDLQLVLRSFQRSARAGA